MDTRPVQRPPAPARKGSALGKGTLIIGLIIFVAAMFFLPQLLGDDERRRQRSIAMATTCRRTHPENVLGVEILTWSSRPALTRTAARLTANLVWRR